jgi:perosamine synthetase
MNALTGIAEDHDLLIVSDSAQAHGTEYKGRDVGSFDTMNCYSFYPTKTMATGEGGMVSTNDEGLDRLGRLIRSHGDTSKYNHVVPGLNYRMTEIAAVIGLNQLKNLDEYLARRKRCGKVLREGIGRIEGLSPQKIEDGIKHSYSYFSLVMDPEEYNCTRDRFLEALRAENVDCAVHYPAPLTKQSAITSLMKPQECPVSEEVAQRIFSLPMHPWLSDEDLSNILAGVEKVAAQFLK